MQRKSRSLTAAAAVTVGALALAGCAGTSSSGGTSASGKTVTLGVSSILSGPYAVYGQVGEGIQAYFKAKNDSGGINGYKFKLDVADNQYQATQAVSITRKFANEGALAVFQLGTPATQAALSLGNQLKVPTVAAANGDLFTPPPSKYVFTVDPQFSRIGLFEANFILKQLHDTSWALAYENDDLGTPVANVLPAYLKDNGGQLSATVPVDATATDFSAQAARLKNSGATVVQAFIGTAAFAGLQKAADAIGFHPTWVTFFTQANPAYPQLVGPLANGVYADNFLNVSGSELTTYQSAMGKYYPKDVNTQFGQLGWSQAAILGAALQKATKGGNLNATSLTNALSSLNGTPAGFLPAVGFSEKSHAAADKNAMYQYSGSTLKQVTSYSDMPAVPAGVNPNG